MSKLGFLREKDGNGITVLMVAAKNNQKELVEYLVDRGINVKASDNSGKTVLDYQVDSEMQLLLFKLCE